MRFTAYLVLAATLLLWSGNWIVARAVRDDVSPGIATAGRLAIALAILAPFVWRGFATRLRELAARDWQLFAAMGLSGGGLHLAMQWLGLHYTTATSATLFLSTSPVFILLLARPVLGERIGLRQWTGIAISFAGVATIAARGDAQALLALKFNVGDLLAVAAMAMWAAYTICLRLRRDTLGIPQTLFLVCAFGMVFVIPWLAWDLAGPAQLTLTKLGMLAIVYSAIGSLLLAYAGWSYVVRRLGASRAGATMHLMPAISIVLAAIFLDERPSWFHFAGMALILAGVALSTFRVRGAAASSTP